MNKIICNNSPKDVRIYIDGILHLLVLRKKFIGIQSWFEFSTERTYKIYKIEIYTKNKTVLVEHYNKKSWTTILNLLDKNL